jgi:hypothetical protein
MSASKEEFNKARAAFMRRASAPELPASVLKLAYIIAYKEIDVDTQSTFRKQTTLATALNADERTVRNLLRILQPFGLVIEPGHGPGNASTYRIEAVPETDKRKSISGISRTKRKPVSGIGRAKPEIRRTNTGNLAHEKRKPISAPLNKNLQEESPREETLSPSPLSAPKKKAVRRKEGSGKKDRAGPTEGEIDAGFEGFRAVFPHWQQTGMEAARKEFAAAIRCGAEADVINGRARLYGITERARIDGGGDPKYTKQPNNWLREKRYEDPPPPNITIDEDSNIVAVAQPQQQQPRGIFAIAEEMIAEHVAKYGDAPWPPLPFKPYKFVGGKS